MEERISEKKKSLSREIEIAPSDSPREPFFVTFCAPCITLVSFSAIFPARFAINTVLRLFTSTGGTIRFIQRHRNRKLCWSLEQAAANIV